MLSIYDMAIAVFRHRWLLYELVARDLKLRYRGSAFGFAWTFLNPLIFTGVYTLVFAIFMRVSLPIFPLYLLAGLIPWYWFLGAIQQAITAIPDGRVYVGKTVFPTEMLVLVPVVSNGVNFALSLVIVLGIAAVFGHLGWSIVLLPVIVAIQLCMVLGLSLLCATFNVFYRDLQQLVQYALTLVFFLTPIFYPKSYVPHGYAFVVAGSPIAALIACYQSVLYNGRPPNLGELAFAAVFGIFVLGAGIGYFNRYREMFWEYV